MKKILFSVLACTMFAGIAHADMMDGAKGVGAQLGYASPGQDINKNAKAGLVYGVHYYQALQNDFAVVGALDLFSFPKKTGGGDFTDTALSVNGVYNISQIKGLTDAGIMPFAFLGLSYNAMHVKYTGGSKSDSGIGFNIGLGANKNINDKWIAGVTVSYRTFPDVKSAAVGTLKGNATVVGIHVGYKL